VTLHLIFVSDLHLTPTGFGSRGGTGRGAAQSFSDFVDHVAGRRRTEGGDWRLVLLGDTLELLHGAAPAIQPDAARRLDEVAAGQAEVFAALGRAVGSGVHLDVVPGNHDMPLAFPTIQARFLAHLGAEGGPVEFHPWMIHVPGVVYAEHGSQYHDVNAFRSALAPSDRDDPDALDHPLGAYLDLELLARVEGGMRPSPIGTTWASARGAWRFAISRSSRRRPSFAPGPTLEKYAREIDVDPEALQRIASVSRPGIRGVSLRAVEAAAERLIGSRTKRPRAYVPGYLHDAARRIDRILERSGSTVPYIVFGHSHVHEREQLRPQAPVPALLGTGTWTTEGPRGARVTARDGAYPFVEIHRVEGHVTEALAIWDASQKRREVIG